MDKQIGISYGHNLYNKIFFITLLFSIILSIPYNYDTGTLTQTILNNIEADLVNNKEGRHTPEDKRWVSPRCGISF